MLTLIVLVTFLAFFLFYHTSRKVKLNRSLMMEKWAHENQKMAKTIGVGFLLLALVGSIYFWGITSGIFAFFVTLMTVGSLIILIRPLRYLNFKWVACLFLIGLITEILFF